MTQIAREYVTTSPVAEQHMHVSWRAVIAGIVVALAVEVLLSLLGVAVGLTAFAPTQGAAKSVGIGLGIWLMLTAIASVFAGAYFGARVAGDPWKGDGVAHGVMVWAGFTLISLWLFGSGVGKVLSGAAGLAGAAVGALGSPDMPGQVVGTLKDLGSGSDVDQPKRAAPGSTTGRAPSASPPSEGDGAKVVGDVASGGAVASWVGFGIALLSLLGGSLGGMLGAVGEQKQVVRHTRRVSPIEPTHTEPVR